MRRPFYADLARFINPASRTAWYPDLKKGKLVPVGPAGVICTFAPEDED
jgi:hypothetical protein